MNRERTLSRRSFIRRIAVTGVVAAGATSSLLPFVHGVTAQGGLSVGSSVYVASDDVNLRTGAGLTYSIIRTYSNGATATVVGGPTYASGYSWFNIRKYDGTTGWMAVDFIGGPIDDGGSHGGEWSAGAYVMTSSSLNLRTAPGTNSSIIRTYSGGTTATVLAGPQSATGYQWYKVEVWDDGRIGWFAGEYLETARFEPTGSRRSVVDGPLNVRENPGTSSRILGSVPTGGVVVVRDASFVSQNGYTWANVYVEANSGLISWIAAEFTQET
ncbi:MAG TPA: SH3 domain-containing protein [Thermomicrobiales bacterium]|nr:SH3 domain-containing protein [Thermomicrobiales bacterium]